MISKFRENILFRGGILGGFITEIYGESGVGKS
jgi:RecA/RadA recombinase